VLSGITIQFDFQECKGVTPPHKFLSESHINCLGIAFFLTSVDAFNKQNKFIVLDDLISSFDANHRKRFADLLFEKYDDYQIILLTHEKSWFDIVKNLARSKGWNIKTIKHNEAKGTHLEDSPQTVMERIEQKIANGNESGLGNDARKYLENKLKLIALNLNVEVAFRLNDVNEDRMAFELLTKLKSTITKRKSTELESKEVIDRLLRSLFIGNKDSHDSSIELTFGDMKAFWQDVTDFEDLFFCDTCKSSVSLRYYDEGTKQVRCKKGELSYTWKK
jgi:wobble nucleotide-excising tRNase